jgi:hypothetical protein
MASTMGMKESCSDREELLLQAAREAFRDSNHRLKRRQLHKAGIEWLYSIRPDSQEYVISDDRADCYDFGVNKARSIRDVAVTLCQRL